MNWGKDKEVWISNPINFYNESLNSISFTVDGEAVWSGGRSLGLAVSAATYELHELRGESLNQASTSSSIKNESNFSRVLY